MKIMDIFTQSGVWWLPDHPSKAIAGTLTYSDSEGIKLDLIGSFRNMDEPYPENGYPLILGHTTKATSVTLWKSLIQNETRAEASHSSCNFATQSLYVNYAFFGVHFRTIEEIRFHKAEIEFNHLQDWLGSSRLHKVEHVGEGLGKLRITYTLPELVTATTHKGSIAVCHSHEVFERFAQGIKVQQSVHFSIEAKEDLDFPSWYGNFIYPLQTFLTLATDKWTSVMSVHLFSKSFTSPSYLNVEEPIKAYFKPYNRSDKQDALYEPLFTFGHVENDFSGIMDRWQKILDKYLAPCELFFSVLFTPKMYLENQFLNLVQAVESFHRIKEGGNVTFRKRIEALVDDTWEMIHWMFGNTDEFVSTVVATRNYYTHRDSTNEVKAAHGDELRGLAESLKFMLHAALLHELQLPSHLYNNMFQKSYCYRFGRRSPKRQNTPRA